METCKAIAILSLEGPLALNALNSHTIEHMQVVLFPFVCSACGAMQRRHKGQGIS